MPVSINNTQVVFNDATTQTTAPVNTNANVNSATALAGTGISVSALTTTGAATHTITNTGVTSVTAGTGISVSASTGGVTISSTGSSSYVGARGQVFTASGTFTIPTGVTALKVTVVGGGGGGFGGGCCPGAGGTGGTSSVSSGTQTITTVSATGGAGCGGVGGGPSGPGVGGLGSGGDLNITGSYGTGSGISSAGGTIFAGSITGVDLSGKVYGGGGRFAGGGGSAIKFYTGLTAGNTLTVTRGAGGTAGAGDSYTGAAGVILIEW